jgi:3D (Asp-Asp-Asp) domain-containing protein
VNRWKQFEQYRRNMYMLSRPDEQRNRIALAVAFGAAALALVILIATESCAGDQTSRRLRVTATGYCAGPCAVCQTTGVTAIGGDAHANGARGCAVDPVVIPLGSRIDVPNHGAWIPADDVGGSIKGQRIDVRFMTHAEAKRYGVRSVVIRVWE